MLIYPMPIALASEVTETETFDGTNGTQVTDLGIPSGTAAIDSDNVAIRNDQNCCGVGGQYFFSMLDNQTSQNANTTGFTFTLPSDHNIKEVGFRTAGVNSNYTIQYNYSDSTNETVNYNGQSGATYEDITKAVTDKFITSFVITVSDWSGIDTIYWKYDDTTTTTTTSTTTTTTSTTTTTTTTSTTTTTTTVPTVGVPTNFTATRNGNGSITLDWDAPTTGNQTPDRYTVQYGDNGVLDQNPTTTDTEMTLTRNELETALGLSNSEGIAYMFHVKSENVAQSIESSFTDVETITISQAPDNSASTYAVTETTDGINIEWITPSSNWVDIAGYKVIYSETDSDDYNSDVWQYLYVSTDTSVTEYTIPWTDNFENWDYGTINGNRYFRISTCSASWWCNDVKGSFQFKNTLGPPMNPTVENVYDSGVLVEWDVPNTGNRTPETYELYYRIGDGTNTVVTGITDTQYTIPYNAITNDNYTFSIRSVNTSYNVYSGYSTEPTLEVFDQKAQDDADAQAEADRIAREQAEEEERQRREAEERERQRLKALEEERNRNYEETGYYELDGERADREQAEYEAEQERIRLEEEEKERQRLQALEDERNSNYAETGYYELDGEREARELAEEKARIEEEIKNSVVIPVETETDEDGNVVVIELTEEEEKELEELVDAIIDIKKNVDFKEYQVEPEEFEVIVIIEDIVILEDPVEKDKPEQTETDTSDSGDGVQEVQPDTVFEPTKSEEELEDLSEEELEEYKEERKEVVEAYVEELEEEIIEEVLPETVTVEDFKEIKQKDVEELTEEEVAIVVEVATEVIEEVVDTEELEEVIEAEDIEILEEEELEDLSEEELEAYEEELEEVIEEFVEELETEELVVVVEQIAEVGVENLAVADEQTIKVVQAVVAEVVDTETVAELSNEEVEAVAEVLGFEEEEDVEIIAEVAAKDETVAEAVSEYVERAVENADTENYTLADVVTEVQVEVFLEDPVGSLTDVDFSEITISNIGYDMTSDQKEKAQEVVVPVIIVSQVIAQAGSILTRRF